MHFACMVGATEVVLFLIEAKVDVNRIDRYNALMLGAHTTSVVASLLASGAKVLDDPIMCTEGTELMWSVAFGNPSSTALFLQHGARPDTTGDCGRSALFWAMNDRQGLLPLQTQCMDVLLRWGADTEIVDYAGLKSLHYAIKLACKDRIMRLIQAGATVTGCTSTNPSVKQMLVSAQEQGKLVNMAMGVYTGRLSKMLREDKEVTTQDCVRLLRPDAFASIPEVHRVMVYHGSRWSRHSSKWLPARFVSSVLLICWVRKVAWQVLPDLVFDHILTQLPREWSCVK